MLDLSPLVNKTVPFKFNGAELRFDLSHALFSSFEVDAGTRLLLKTVARDPVLARAARVLDEGCGVGPIGLSVAKAFPGTEVVMRDRDALALAFSERNRLANRLQGRKAWTDPEGRASRTELPAPSIRPGLLADGLEEGPYDYVLSNLPAKAGGPVLEAFFARAPRLLAPGGRLAVVIVRTLADAAEAWLAGAGMSVVATGRGANHRVYVAESVGIAEAGAPAEPKGASGSGPAPAPGAEAPGGPAAPGVGAELRSAGAPDGRPLGGYCYPSDPLAAGLDLSSYLRTEAGFSLEGKNYRARGFWGLPDFDSVGYAQELAASVASRACAGSLVREALIVNPGVGHLALWAARTLGPARITAMSRDLLSLAATAANLAALPAARRPAFRVLDVLELEAPEEAAFDLLVEFPDVVPGYDWVGPFWERARRALKTGAALVAACPPTELARLDKRRGPGWRLLAERRRRGFASAAWLRS